MLCNFPLDPDYPPVSHSTIGCRLQLSDLRDSTKAIPRRQQLNILQLLAVLHKTCVACQTEFEPGQWTVHPLGWSFKQRAVHLLLRHLHSVIKSRLWYYQLHDLLPFGACWPSVFKISDQVQAESASVCVVAHFTRLALASMFYGYILVVCLFNFLFGNQQQWTINDTGFSEDGGKTVQEIWYDSVELWTKSWIKL